MPSERDIYDDEITKYLAILFDSVSEDMRVRWTAFETSPDSGGKGKAYTVYMDEQAQLQTTPSIEIVSKGTTNDIFSIGTQEQRFDYDIYVSVANNHPEQAKMYLKAITYPVFDLLNDFNRRAFTVPGRNFCVYYSEATSIDWNLRRGKGHLAARIVWYCKLLKIVSK